jgi:RimJ/RimL family protein N-acetyltransferase
MSEINPKFFQGKLVRLITPIPEEDSILLSDWTRDSGFSRFAMGEPARYRYPVTIKKWFEETSQSGYPFMVVTQVENKKIGEIEIDGINHLSGNGWLGIGIGERSYWGKGYGSEAIILILDFAFLWLNLHRVSLDVFEYNTRGVRAYEKLGFKLEGRKRGALLRDGQRWDLLYMGILKDEWIDMKQRINLNE